MNFISDFKKRKQTYVQRLRQNSFSQMSNAHWRFGQQPQNTVSEIIVPTCSYRMGSNNIGYSVLTIGNFLKIITFYLKVNNINLTNCINSCEKV